MDVKEKMASLCIGVELFLLYDTSVKRSKSCSCLHDKAFELGTRQI